MTIKHIGKFCSGAAIALVVITALGPRQLAAPHVTRLGDRPLGYFAITLPVCFAWPRPVIVGGALMVFAALLEWLQGLTPDRTSNLQSHLLVVRSLQLCCIATKQMGHGFSGSGLNSDRIMPAYDCQCHRSVSYGCFLSAVRNPSCWLCRELPGERCS